MTLARARDQRPNLLLIMADQHRYDWLGVAGANWVRTPHLDALAGRGVRFTQTTCNAPLCAPSRISLASGLQPHRVGAMGNNAFYPRHVPTYYQELRDAGYRVGLVGKLDLHKPDTFNGRRGNLPLLYSYGFTDPVECEGKMHAGSGWPEPHGPYNHYLQERGRLQAFCEDYRKRGRAKAWYAEDSVLPTEDWEDCYIARRAAEFIAGQDGDSPWHLFVSFVGPHDPWDPPAEYAEHFRRRPMPQPVADAMDGKPQWIERKARSQAGASPEEVATVRRQYTAALELIDAQVGLLLDTLAKTGAADNTYVFYTSDHGEMLGDHGLYQKSVFYEPAVRVPLLAVGPGIPQAESGALVEMSDLHPTLLELAGVSPRIPLDARSLWPVLRDPAASHRINTLSQLTSARCLRTDHYKLIDNINDRPELYDLQEDPTEGRNLAEQRPDVLAEMRRALGRRLL